MLAYVNHLKLSIAKCYIGSDWTFSSSYDSEFDFLSFKKGIKCFSPQGRSVNKNIFTSIKWGDKAKPLIFVKPLNKTYDFR
ncbi:hypothetical protein APT89_05545 [Enterobacter sp. 50588862]|nr:hypothetical protein L465_01744 [Enterobacter sp. BIDMC 29]KSX65232.1 hypothetical protein APT89_05545 [Enterobacter sp. 50588862]